MKLTITLYKSPIGYRQKTKDTVKALGLSKLNQSVTHNDTPQIRGMINKVRHLVTVEEIN